MGFRLDRTYALRWDAGDLAGLEIDIRSTSVGTLREMRSLREGTPVNGKDANLVLAEILVDHIRRWNFEDENGEPLPVTVDSLMAQESAVLRAIAREWYLAAAGVSAPLDDGSTSTEPSPEESIPMEAL